MKKMMLSYFFILYILINLMACQNDQTAKENTTESPLTETNKNESDLPFIETTDIFAQLWDSIKIPMNNRNVNLSFVSNPNGFIVPLGETVGFSANQDGQVVLKLDDNNDQQMLHLEKYNIDESIFGELLKDLTYKDVFNITNVTPMFNQEETESTENGEISYFIGEEKIAIISFLDGKTDEILIVGIVIIE